MARKTKYGIGGTRVEIEGDEELIRMLNGMSKGFRSKALLHAVTQGAEIVEREAKARAPVRKGGKGGTLRRSITTVKLKATSKLAKVAVSWRKGRASRTAAFYGIMLEKGTRPRFRKKWREKTLKKPASTGRGPQRAFLIPAYLSKREQVAREIKVQLSRLIRRAVKKGL
jgi:HK97 gp10 family phage protein